MKNFWKYRFYAFLDTLREDRALGIEILAFVLLLLIGTIGIRWSERFPLGSTRTVIEFTTVIFALFFVGIIGVTIIIRKKAIFYIFTVTGIPAIIIGLSYALLGFGGIIWALLVKFVPFFRH